jgi:coenzyme F420-0:L-glutamate ligase/coenzyme F420-1:gamma-L-glutamate ligase
VHLDDVRPGSEAEALAAETGKDPRLVQLILDESVAVVRKRRGTPERPGVIIVEHRCGWVHANAGIDQSNLDEDACALLLPVDCDASAASLRDALGTLTGTRPGVVVADSAGRAWRVGTVGMALGAAGVETVQDLRGQPDLQGRILEVTVVGRGDELAAAAGLVMGQACEAVPAVLVRGLPAFDGTATARELIRPGAEDMFR